MKSLTKLIIVAIMVFIPNSCLANNNPYPYIDGTDGVSFDQCYSECTDHHTVMQGSTSPTDETYCSQTCDDITE